jgi:hypothetical protein
MEQLKQMGNKISIRQNDHDLKKKTGYIELKNEIDIEMNTEEEKIRNLQNEMDIEEEKIRNLQNEMDIEEEKIRNLQKEYIEIEKLRTSTGCEAIFKDRVCKIAYPCKNILDNEELISLSNYKYLCESFSLIPESSKNFDKYLFHSFDERQKSAYLSFFHKAAEKEYIDRLTLYYPLKIIYQKYSFFSIFYGLSIVQIDENFKPYDRYLYLYHDCTSRIYDVYFENKYYKKKEEKDEYYKKEEKDEYYKKEEKDHSRLPQIAHDCSKSTHPICRLEITPLGETIMNFSIPVSVCPRFALKQTFTGTCIDDGKS